MANIKPYLQRMIQRLVEPGVQTTMKGFNKTLQFNFTDTGESWLIRVSDGKEATLTMEVVEKPDILVSLTTDTLAGIMDKKISGSTAYMQRKIQVKGVMVDLLRLQKLMF